MTDCTLHAASAPVLALAFPTSTHTKPGCAVMIPKTSIAVQSDPNPWWITLTLLHLSVRPLLLALHRASPSKRLRARLPAAAAAAAIRKRIPAGAPLTEVVAPGRALARAPRQLQSLAVPPPWHLPTHWLRTSHGSIPLSPPPLKNTSLISVFVFTCSPQEHIVPLPKHFINITFWLHVSTPQEHIDYDLVSGGAHQPRPNPLHSSPHPCPHFTPPTGAH